MRYFIELSYNGSAYCGWQRQPNATTVQEVLEKNLSMLLRCDIQVTGAGRTDTGVHASHYVAHFDLETKEGEGQTLDCDWLTYKLNLTLPHDIAIKSLYHVDTEAHARFDATEREYTYIIEQHKNPFTRHTAWHLTTPLNIEEMNRAAAHLLQHSDFTSFAKLGGGNKTNICDIREAIWHYDSDSGRLTFTIKADRFLRNMIRAIVGTLVDVGRGRYSAEQFDQIITKRDLSLASSSAPAQGLFLSAIKY